MFGDNSQQVTIPKDVSISSYWQIICWLVYGVLTPLSQLYRGDQIICKIYYRGTLMLDVRFNMIFLYIFVSTV